MSLAALLGLGDHELVSLVGGGGKSTMLFSLGEELVGKGKRVILTTTTKMGREQAMVAPSVCWLADTACAIEALDKAGPVMLVTGGDDHKVTGPPPELVDELFERADADYIIVEADGSRGLPLKAPAAWEPVIPSKTTTVVILMGIDAIGRPLGQVTHRVEQGLAFSGRSIDHVLTPADCAAVLVHPDGALRVCPSDSKVVIALTKVETVVQAALAEEMRRHIRDDISLVIVPATPS